MGLSASTFSLRTAFPSRSGLQSYACFEYLPIASGVGTGNTPRVPVKSWPMYSLMFRARGSVGFGPLRFGLELSPLPLAKYRLRSLGLKRTQVGYQPVGMKPSGF